MSRTNPTRRGFIVGAALAAAGSPAVTEVATAEPSPYFRGLVEAGEHPLRQRVAVAVYQARSWAEVLWHAHAKRCKEEGCRVCESVGLALFHLGLYCAVAEDGLTPGGEVERAERDFRRVLAEAKRGSYPMMPPARAHNQPAQEPLVLALVGLADALGALLDGHGCKGVCEVCDDANDMQLGVWHLRDAVKSSMAREDGRPPA
jgi:hypothetical protein